MELPRLPLLIATLTLGVSTLQGRQGSGLAPKNPESFRFKGGVELVNVTATVIDSRGRFMSGLTQADFVVYEDDVRQTVTQFGTSRVPVSLGIALDTSSSMAGQKIAAARGALDRFLVDLLEGDDEVFLYCFGDRPVLFQDWTTDRVSLSHALGRIRPSGGTAMFDTVAEALPVAAEGRRQKKALLVISDGNDTSSRLGIREVQQQIRESEVMVYAVGIDGDEAMSPPRAPVGRPQPRRPIPFPPPFPGGPGRRPGSQLPRPEQAQIFVPGDPSGGRPRVFQGHDRANVGALRDLTDDSGGRTAIVHDPRDLDPATASIADELSRQYELGYASSGKKDGLWHSIRVEIRTGRYHVRARRGYIAN